MNDERNRETAELIADPFEPFPISGLEATSPDPNLSPGAFPFPDWWRCYRFGPVSGRYEGEMREPRAGSHVLDLRVDIEPRFQDSPVTNRVSGDIYQVFSFRLPGRPPITWRVYRESWIVDSPAVNWTRCSVTISGTVNWWQGAHPQTEIQIEIPWRTFSAAGPATVNFQFANDILQTYRCTRRSDAFRTINLEVDIVQSVNSGTLLPDYDTHAHTIRPAGVRQRMLTIPEAYREAGLEVIVRADRTIIDDSAASFSSWSPAELHDAMETHFSQIGGGWPRWEMWGLLAGEFDNPGVGGIMFDAAAAYGGAGDAPERQGFAVFRNHRWFDNLPDDAPQNQLEAQALRHLLYTWVHEAGHAFNFLHSWNKSRPDALSWMNYDWRYDNRNGADSFWSAFEFRFDEEELIHLRHGNRASVIMGGDPWASGGHMESLPGMDHVDAPVGAMAQVEGSPPLEVLVRSKEYFEFLEPVEIEVRLRNLLQDIPLAIDEQLDPSFGGVVIFIKRPDGRIVEYDPIMCKLAEPKLRMLQPLTNGNEGTDRFSQNVFLSYGRNGFYFDLPGDYFVRVMYQGSGDTLIPSGIHRIRIGHPTSKEEDRLAQDFFTYPVGMSLYLGGSQSSHLETGMNTLRDVAERFEKSIVGAKAATIVAESVAQPFFQIQEQDEKRVLRQTHKPQPKDALKLTKSALSLYKSAEGKEARALNLGYHQLVRDRSHYLAQVDQEAQARKELNSLADDLDKRGVNEPVLEEIRAFAQGFQGKRSKKRRKAAA